MDEVLKFLTENRVFYLATVEGGKPKVRPFGFVMNYEGKLCFCTNNQKDVFKQMQANPYVEICTTSADGQKWVRIRGKVVFNTTAQSKAKCLEVMPELKRLYSVDDPKFETFYLDEAEATFYTLAEGPIKTVKL